ncbi:MAG: IclR family transcriptional regulator [Bacteroidota bacterium]|nr:IclR family transcriptional regulator [Bacteroidota bacterium]MDP4205175.1 IclR family transcriptional regulator [Bacteroidota bacterium]
MTEKQDPNFQTPMLDRAFDIIELLSKNSNGLGISEIMRILDIPKNSVFRITGALYQRGYLIRDEKTKFFSLSRKLVDVGFSALGKQDLLEESLDVMREIQSITKETTLLGIVAGKEGIIMNQIPSSHQIKLTVDVGMCFSLYCSAPGKAYLAFLPENESNELINKLEIKKHTSRTITSKVKLLEELKNIRKQGYSTDLAEEFEGVHCIGAPILNQDGYPIAVVWITGPSYRFPEQNFNSIGELVKEKVEMISKKFGFKQL